MPKLRRHNEPTLKADALKRVPTGRYRNLSEITRGAGDIVSALVSNKKRESTSMPNSSRALLKGFEDRYATLPD